MITRAKHERIGISPAALLGTILLIAVAVTLATGAIGDYAAYIEQWALVTAGEDPWSPTNNGEPVPFNAYGPFHAVIGYAVMFHPLAPKVLFALMAVATFALLLAIANSPESGTDGRSILFLALLLPLSPLVIVHTYAYGGNDIFCVLLCVIACALRARDLLVPAGIALALGALMKFYPLLFAAFLCLSHSSFPRLRLLIAAFAVFLAGMAFSALVLDWDVMSAIGGGVTRDPKSLSILRFAQSVAGTLDITAFQNIVDFLIDRNSFFVLGAVGAVALWGWVFDVNWRIVTLIGVLMTFATYKVGHTQFFLVWVAIQGWILAENGHAPSVKVASDFLPLTVFFSLLALKSALLSFAYILFPQHADTFGMLDYDWRTVSSVVFWSLIIFCLVKSRKWMARDDHHVPVARF